MLEDLEGTVCCVFVAMGLQTLQRRINEEVLKMLRLHQNHSIGGASHLHPGFYHIQGRVSKHTGSARRGSKHRRHDWVHFFPGVVTLKTQTMGSYADTGRAV